MVWHYSTNRASRRLFEFIKADFIHNHGNAKHFRVIVVYRPPPSKKANYPFSTFIDEFPDLHNRQVLFTGDLIIFDRRFSDLLMQYNMQRVNTGTHTIHLPVTQ